MKTPLLLAAWLLSGALLADVSGTARAATATASTAKDLLKATRSHAFMVGDRLMVTGSSMGLTSENEARIFAVKDAAQTAAEFLEKTGLGPSREIQQGVENAVLRETPFAALEKGAIRVEDLRQERWSIDRGADHYSIYLVLSIRVGKKARAAK